MCKAGANGFAQKVLSAQKVVCLHKKSCYDARRNFVIRKRLSIALYG
jgi:hypothetical protein